MYFQLRGILSWMTTVFNGSTKVTFLSNISVLYCIRIKPHWIHVKKNAFRQNYRKKTSVEAACGWEMRVCVCVCLHVWLCQKNTVRRYAYTKCQRSLSRLPEHTFSPWLLPFLVLSAASNDFPSETAVFMGLSHTVMSGLQNVQHIHK